MWLPAAALALPGMMPGSDRACNAAISSMSLFAANSGRAIAQRGGADARSPSVERLRTSSRRRSGVWRSGHSKE